MTAAANPVVAIDGEQDAERGYRQEWLEEVVRSRSDPFELPRSEEAETELPY